MATVKIQYRNQSDRSRILSEKKDMYLIEEQILIDGNFLIFSGEKPVSEVIKEMNQENTLIKAQNQALTERADFIEDVVAEMAAQVYQ